MVSLRKRPARNSAANEQNARSRPTSNPPLASSPPKEAAEVKKPDPDGPWIEPQIPRQKATFEEEGLERGGVLYHMQPLGQKPTPKYKAKMRREARASSRRSLLPTYSGDEGMRDTPDTPISGVHTREPSERLDNMEDEIMEDVPLPTQEAEDDGDYMPRGSKRTASGSVKTTEAVNGDITRYFSRSRVEAPHRPLDGALERTPYESSPLPSTGLPSSEPNSPATEQTGTVTASNLNVPGRASRQTRSKATPKSSQPTPKSLSLSVTVPKDAAAPMPSPSTTSPAPSMRRTRSKSNAPQTAPTPPGSAPSAAKGHVAESDSELSEVDEEIAQGPPPEPLTSNDLGSASLPAWSRQSSTQPKGRKFNKKVNPKKRPKPLLDDVDFSEDDDDEREAKRAKFKREFDDVDIAFSDVRCTERVPGVDRPSTPLSWRSPTPPDRFVDYSWIPEGAGVWVPTKDKEEGEKSGANADEDATEETGETDRDKLCAACGKSGTLVSCKSCLKNFHNHCFDRDAAGDTQYCAACEAFSEDKTRRFNLFGVLDFRVADVKPQGFALPEEIRDYYQGVETGPRGEYMETRTWVEMKTKNGWLEQADTTRTTDKDGKVILCDLCGGAARPDRGIIRCDVEECGGYWHLDCCEPPLANPPTRREDKKKRQFFLCPRHIDHDLRHLTRRMVSKRRKSLHDGAEDRETRVDSPQYEQTYRVRVPKRPRVVDALAPRGRRNNGIIEIEQSSDEDEFYTEEDDGRVEKYPSKAIVLNFIEKAKEQAHKIRVQRNAELRRQLEEEAAEEKARQQLAANMRRHDFRDGQAAIHLARLSHRDPWPQGTGVDQLISALAYEAPADVTASITKEERRKERADLQELKRRIAEREARLDAEEALVV